MKTCGKCGKQKLLSEFHKRPTGKDGFRTECKECRKIHYHKYYQTHKIEFVIRSKKYRQTHKIEIAQQKKQHHRTIIGCLRSCFRTLKYRCTSPICTRYKDYGGRGIKCLFKSSDEFLNYVINELQIDPRGLQIDRIDNNGNYESGNIRFVTAKINSNNRRKRKCKN